MPFKSGEGGRPLGAINKRSKEFLEVLDKHDFCPASALIECYKNAKKTYDNYGEIYDAICDARADKEGTLREFVSPTEDNAHKYLKIAADIAKDIAGYAYPKLKAIERTENDPLKGMTTEQRLEAMKHAVAMLELQVKSSSEPGTN